MARREALSAYTHTPPSPHELGFKTLDFFIFNTTFPHSKLKDKIKELVQLP